MAAIGRGGKRAVIFGDTEMGHQSQEDSSCAVCSMSDAHHSGVHAGRMAVLGSMGMGSRLNGGSDCVREREEEKQFGVSEVNLMMENGSPGHPRGGEGGGRRQVVRRGEEGSASVETIVPRRGSCPVSRKVTVSVDGEGEEAGRCKVGLGVMRMWRKDRIQPF